MRHCSVLLITFLALASQAQTPAKIPDHPSKLRFPQLDWKVPFGTPYRAVLGNGLVAYVAEDHHLPLIEIVGYVRYGSILDPQGKEGLGRMTAALLRSGGTERYSPDTLEALLERMAIELSFAVSETDLVFNYTFLSEFTDTALGILEQILFHPSFDKDRIGKERGLLEEEILHRFDNPGPVLSAGYKKAMYAKAANSRLSTIQSIRAISRNDMIRLHQRVFRTENIILSAAGDFSRDRITQRLSAIFPKATNASDTLKNSIRTASPAKLLVIHKATTQAYVRFGIPLFTRPHPDYYPVSVLDLVLGGGGFTSRLGTKIRSDEGLTYSIHSQAESNYIFPATFSVSFHTKTESTQRALALSLAEIDKIRKDGITDEELSNAKKVLIDGLPSMFRSPADIVKTYAWNEFYGRPADQYFTYPAKINAITRDEVLRVARKYLDPSQFTYVVVADTSKLFSADTVKGFLMKEKSPIKTTLPDSLSRLW